MYFKIKMASVTPVIFFTLLIFITTAEGEKKRKIDKIIIHVPYKIHKHHHTHTKYKVITVPAPKKENTVIYLKEEIQPIIKQVPAIKETNLIETQPKPTENFIPPHQQSASALLDSIANHKDTILTDQQQHDSTILDDQKSVESHSDLKPEDFVPNFRFKLLPSHENLIPNFPLKPMVLPQQNVFTPKLLLNPTAQHSYEAFLPKFSYQPLLHLPQNQYNSKYIFNPITPFSKTLYDSAHTGGQVYKTLTFPRSKASYKVWEENQDNNIQNVKHQHSALNTPPLSPIKPMRTGKNFPLPNLGNKFKSGHTIQPDPDFEYEHVGYLIIDGNSRKMVGKNLKDEIHLSKLFV